MFVLNKLFFIVLVIIVNLDSVFMKIEEILNIIVIFKYNFILDDEFFLVWLYIIKGILRSFIIFLFNRLFVCEEIFKI